MVLSSHVLHISLREISVDFARRAETREFVDPSFEIPDFTLEFLCLWFVDSRELVFEALEARFFDLFVDIGLADVLAFVDLVEIRLRKVGDFECLIDFGGVDASDTFAVDASVFEFVEDYLVVFEASIASTGALDGAVLAVDRLVVVEVIEEKRAHILTEIVGIALDIRAERIEIDQLGGLHGFEVSWVVPFEGVDQEQRIRVEWEVGFFTREFRVLAFDTEVGVDERRGSRIVGGFQDAVAWVDLEEWVNREDGGVGFGISREAIKIEGLWRIRDAVVERFELLAFEGDGRLLVAVGDEKPMFLGVFDVKWLVRKRGSEGTIGWHLVDFVEDRVPDSREWYWYLPIRREREKMVASDTEFNFQNLKLRSTIMIPKCEERDALRLGGLKRQRGPDRLPCRSVHTLCGITPFVLVSGRLLCKMR